MAEESQALSLSWVYGSSYGVKGSVVNLSDGHSERVCYLAAHDAVIYDQRLNKQIFLQGHCNSIACLTATPDRSTIVTADIGKECLLVLWNSRTGSPIRSHTQLQAYGICSLALSPDGQLLVAISAPNPETSEQEIALYSLASLASQADPKPLAKTAIPTGDAQTSVAFSPNNQQEIITNGKRRVYFWNFEQQGRFKYYSPPLRSNDFKQNVGDFVMSVFVPGTTQALTATVDGDLVVWDEQGMTAQVGTSASDRRATKLMRIHSCPVTHLTTIGDYVVSAGEDGFVRFFDPLLRIVAWFEDLGAGPVTSIAFSNVSPDRLAYGDLGSTLNKFMVPNFVIATTESKIVAVQSSSFEEFDAAKRTGTVLLQPLPTDVVDLATHPARPEFAVLSQSGLLQRWDQVNHVCVASRTFDKQRGHTLLYAKDGSFIVVGLEGGYINIISSQGLEDIHTTRNTAADIVSIACSTTGRHLAVADANNQVLLYAFLPHKSSMRWEYVGKSRAHHGKIVGLCFGESPSGETRLFSLGQDSRLVEYDLQGCSVGSGVQILSHHDFPPGSFTPTALCFAPPLPYFKHFAAETQLLICDEGYKVRVFNPDTKSVVATYAGPTFGGHLTKVITFKSSSSSNAFLAYSCAERVVGLVAWPLDGDPSQTMGLIAHPGNIGSVALSFDGRKLLSLGVDGCLNQWDINTSTMESKVAASAAQPDRWCRVLGDDSLLEDLKDYFVYAQLRAQGEDARQPRHITGSIPVGMVPDVMRAVGYYPSEADVANIMNHIRFLAQSRDLETLTSITFDDLLYLFINHRPLNNVTLQDIAAAFAALGANPKLSRDGLAALLGQLGEGMGREELDDVVVALTGVGKWAEAMPHSVDARLFAGEVLGFEE